MKTPIDYALVYIGLGIIGRSPKNRLADMSDAQILIGMGAETLLRTEGPLQPRSDALKALLAPAPRDYDAEHQARLDASWAAHKAARALRKHNGAVVVGDGRYHDLRLRCLAKSYTITSLRHTTFDGASVDHETGYSRFAVQYFSTAKEGTPLKS